MFVEELFPLSNLDSGVNTSRSFVFFTLFSNYRWAVCPTGYYLNGMRAGGLTYIHLIEEAQCCRPQNHPNSYENCYDEDVKNSLGDWRECKQAGYYIAGLYRGSCDKFECIEKLRCCMMKTGNSIFIIALSLQGKLNILHIKVTLNTHC